MLLGNLIQIFTCRSDLAVIHICKGSKNDKVTENKCTYCICCGISLHHKNILPGCPIPSIPFHPTSHFSFSSWFIFLRKISGFFIFWDNVGMLQEDLAISPRGLYESQTCYSQIKRFVMINSYASLKEIQTRKYQLFQKQY